MRFPALQSKDFVIYMAGNFSATNAIWINRVIVGWLGWELTGLASWVGFLSFLLYAPTISSPFFGAILDRFDLRRGTIVCHSLLTVAVAILLVLWVMGLLTIWLLGLVALAIGFVASADRTIRLVLVPRLVDKEALTNAIAIQGLNTNTSRLIGPALGGFLIDIFGTVVAIIVNFVMFLPFLASLFIVTLRERDAPNAKRRRFFNEIVDGARHAASHPVIREAMILTAVFSITLSGVLEIIPAIADGVFQRGAQGLGQMLAVAGGGALAAAILVLMRRPRLSGPAISRAVYISVFAGSASVIILGATSSWLAALTMVFVLGACLTINNIDLQTSLQIALDDTYRGRVMSLWVVLVIGGIAVSAIVLGFLADIFGMSAALIGSGATCAAIGSANMFGNARRASPAPPGA